MLIGCLDVEGDGEGCGIGVGTCMSYVVYYVVLLCGLLDSNGGIDNSYETH